MKIYKWNSCSNLIIPKFSQGCLTEKRRLKSKNYKGYGRPRKTDYEYKSILDMMFEVDKLFNFKVS